MAACCRCVTAVVTTPCKAYCDGLVTFRSGTIAGEIKRDQTRLYLAAFVDNAAVALLSLFGQ